MRRFLYCTLSAFILVAFAGCKKKTDTPETNKPTVQTTPWPEWIFHHWIWEDESTQASAQQIVDDYLAHDIPVGAIIIDSPWETQYNNFTWDKSRFQDPKAMVDYFHSKNIKVFMWIVSVIDTDAHPIYDYAKTHNYFMKVGSADANPGIVKWWKGKGSLIDLWNPDAVNWWKGMMDSVLAIGVDGWKCDGTDFLAGGTPYSGGKGGNITRNEYSNAYYQLFFDYSRQKNGIDRVITSRPIDNYGYDVGGDGVAFTPKDISYACWVGDQDATFDGLMKALRNMYYSDQYGYLSFGSDIGGYREDAANPGLGRSKELFLRWAQMGAFCSIMENGGGGEHRPWLFDNETTDVYRRFVKIHEAAVPYLMTTADSVYKTHKAIMQFYNKTDFSYKLGPDIFVTPILASGGTVSINFPVGSNWVYLFDKTKTYTGGSSTTETFPINEFPVYVREGASVGDVLRKVL